MLLSKRDRDIYLQGLRRYKDMGVRILVDGSDDERRWNRILQVSDDAYYMGDYVEDGSTGKLQEIRFDKVRMNSKKKRTNLYKRG